MRLCVISSGVPHAVPRTLAFAAAFDEVDFIDTNGSADSSKLSAVGIRYHRLEDFHLSRIPAINLQEIFGLLCPDIIVVHFCSGVHFFSAIAYGRCPVAGIVMGSDVLYERGK